MQQKTYNLISNIQNGAGLQRDCEILFSILDKMGHRVRLINYESNFTGINYTADVNIFLEVMVPEMLNFAPNNWLIPNSEWWRGEIGDLHINRINKVLCKTHDCYNIWQKKLSGRCVYIGFEASDFYQSTAEKELSFLHLAGNSGTKNTEAVIEAWRQFRLPYKIDIVILNPAFRTLCFGVPGITYHQRIAESHVHHAINSHLFHLIPAQYEGYGQALHEALGCGGIVITTNAPPMNEFAGIPRELMIPSSGTFEKSLAICHSVTPEGVAEAVMRAAALSKDQTRFMSAAARQAFLDDREAFRVAFKELVK